MTVTQRIGTEDSGYFFEKKLGRGGFGSVYRAKKSDGSVVAVKVLLGELVANPMIVKRFEREVSATACVDHPSCIKVFDSGRLKDGSPYFAMELLEGEDLSRKIRREGRIGEREMLLLLEQVCDALQAAHMQSIVHRDIKASNIFLCTDGRVVLLDFGIAKFVDMPGMTLTMSRQIIGTPCAMAPEQLKGEPVDARTDVYALGALSYQMLTGKQAFAAPTPTLLQHLHCRAARPRPSSRVPVSTAVDGVIVRAMSIEPQRRPRDAGAFLRELETALRGMEKEGKGFTRLSTVFGFLGDCGEDLGKAREGMGRIDVALKALAAQGYKTISLQSRGFVCSKEVQPDFEENSEALCALREIFVDGAPFRTTLYWKSGVVECRGDDIHRGDALIPSPTGTDGKGQQRP